MKESPSSVSDVFSVYIEMAQNIRRYAQDRRFEAEAATVIISHNNNGRYVISASNLVLRDDGLALIEKIQHLAHLDKDGLKTAFKTQLRQPRSTLAGSAGLGLIDMARKASAPLKPVLQPVDSDRSLFSLCVIL